MFIPGPMPVTQDPQAPMKMLSNPVAAKKVPEPKTAPVAGNMATVAVVSKVAASKATKEVKAPDHSDSDSDGEQPPPPPHPPPPPPHITCTL
jgi:hypothetical protein